MARLYSEYVFAQNMRNPCLRNLCHFIANDNTRNACRIISLEFRVDDAKPRRVELDIAGIEAILDNDTDECLGRLIIVEDLSKALIETLGSNFDIDPLFFASHIHGPVVEIDSSKPSLALLPSKANHQNFISLQYQRSLDFGSCPGVPRKLLRSSNVPRKVVLLPSLKNTSIGLEQQSCSILLSETKSKSWLGLILVDKPSSDSYVTPDRHMQLPSRPFQGGYEDFFQRPSFSEADEGAPGRTSLLEDLVWYWQKARPPAFDPKKPTLLSLAYYPVKISAAEWMNYVAVMSSSIKQYEYTTEAQDQRDELRKIDSDLQSLEVWGRRCLQTTSKLRFAIDFLRQRISNDPDLVAYTLLILDFEHISSLVDAYGRRLESMVPVVTSVLQIADTRRSLKEAANVSRLTNLALLFVPLSFVASIFSMNGDLTRHDLALYFAVAIPLCVVVLFVAHLPVAGIGEAIGKRLGSYKGV